MNMMTPTHALVRAAQEIAGDIRQPGRTDRIGYGMHVSTGRWYFPLDPRADEVFIEDIAHGLSNQCRFNGQSSRYLSVAEHSYLVSKIVPRRVALEALLHDAAEAYIGDIIRPLKLIPALRNIYGPIETANEAVIADRFGLTFPWPAEVKVADEVIVTLEMERNIANAEKGELHDASVLIEGVDLRYLDPSLAKALFLHRFMELAIERGIQTFH